MAPALKCHYTGTWRSAWRSCRFLFGETTAGIHWLGGFMGTTSCLDVMTKISFFRILLTCSWGTRSCLL